MSGSLLLLAAKCPRCLSPLACRAVEVDGLPSIDLLAGIGDRVGHVHLSAIYGSFHRRFCGFPDIPGSVAEFCCPRCHEPFPIHGLCLCKAPMVAVDLAGGGFLRICSRNGCRQHHLEFEEANDAFLLYDSQAE